MCHLSSGHVKRRSESALATADNSKLKQLVEIFFGRSLNDVTNGVLDQRTGMKLWSLLWSQASQKALVRPLRGLTDTKLVICCHQSLSLSNFFQLASS